MSLSRIEPENLLSPPSTAKSSIESQPAELFSMADQADSLLLEGEELNEISPSQSVLDEVIIPSDSTSDSESEVDEELSRSLSGIQSIEPVSCKLRYAQAAGRVCLDLAGSAAPVYVVTQLFQPRQPYAAMFGMANFIINGMIGGALNALTTKTDPIARLRGMGFLKRGIKEGSVLASVMVMGYGAGSLLMSWEGKDSPENQAMKWVTTSLNDPSFAIPMLGLTGWGVNKLALKMWDYCWPERKDLFENNKVNSIQVLGQYAMSYFGAYTLDTMFDWYLMAAGAEKIRSDPNLNIMRLTFCYAVREAVEYCSGPQFSGREMKLWQAYSVQEAGETLPFIAKAQPNYRQMVYQAGVNVYIIAVAIAIDRLITCTADPKLCEENTLANRALRDVLALGTALLTHYLGRIAAPKLCQLYRAGCTLFSRKPTGPDNAARGNDDVPLITIR